MVRLELFHFVVSKYVKFADLEDSFGSINTFFEKTKENEADPFSTSLGPSQFESILTQNQKIGIMMKMKLLPF
jgi:hypothetical protein